MHERVGVKAVQTPASPLVRRAASEAGAPIVGDCLKEMRSQPITWRDRAFRPGRDSVRVDDVGRVQWNVIRGDLALPTAVILEGALIHNIDLMARYCSEHGVALAPHGKTTMAPDLFRRQLEAGAWGITAATPAQVRVMREFGITRILLANELVTHDDRRWLRAELEACPDFDFYCLVDSLELLEAIDADFTGSVEPLKVLIELGYPGGRTGCRSVDEAIELANVMHRLSSVSLVGVEGYEGHIQGADVAESILKVDAYLDDVRRFALRLAADGVFQQGEEIVVSCGGSIFFDRVVEKLGGTWPELSPSPRLVLRSGGYISLDSGANARWSPFGGRGSRDRQLQPAIQVWGAILSRPERELAILSAGKRDLPYDIDLPVPQLISREGLTWAPRHPMKIFSLDDQHAYLNLDAREDVRPGDLMGLGVSHTCAAFDRWSLIPVVDDAYNVVDAVRTFF
jgi:D-serine dehydratase